MRRQPSPPWMAPAGRFAHQLQLDLGTDGPLLHGGKGAGEGLPDAADALQGLLRVALPARHRPAEQGHMGAWQEDFPQSPSVGKKGGSSAGGPPPQPPQIHPNGHLDF